VKIVDEAIGKFRVISIPFDSVKTISCAFVVKSGSADEPDPLAGVSHYLEHVVFRGTKKYDHFHLKYIVESVGGVLNAFTERRATVFYIKVPEMNFLKSFDVLKSLVFEPTIDEESVEIERKVILEEYKMNRDDPVSYLHDLLFENVWEGPFGRPILGYENTIRSISKEELVEYHDKMYFPRNMIVVLAGRVNGTFMDVVKKELERIDKEGEKKDNSFPNFTYPSSVTYEVRNDMEQVHVALAKPIPGRESSDYPAIALLNTALGSGMSSLLFHEIREKEGLVYDIYSQIYALRKTGVLVIYSSMSPSNLGRFFEKLKKLLSSIQILENFEYGKNRLLGKLEMMTESPGSVMGFVVDRLVCGLESYDIDSFMEEIKSLDVHDFEKVAKEVLSGNWAVFGLGPDSTCLDFSILEV